MKPTAKPLIRINKLKGRLFTGVVDILNDFGSFTSLHGAKNIVEDFRYLNKPSTRSKLSNGYIIFAKCSSFIMWGGAITIGILLAIKMSMLVWHRSQTSPTLTTVDTYYHPIWDVPFPAVTLCNVNMVYRPKMENYTNKFKMAGFNETAIRNAFSKLSVYVRQKPNNQTVEIRELRRASTQFNMTMDEVLLNVMQPCESLVKQCLWLNKYIPCTELFQISMTSQGFCCSFNYIGTSKWPGRNRFYASGAGDNVGLDLFLSPDPKEYYSYTRPFYGIQVAIHQQEDYPDMKSHILVQPGYDVKVLITPSVLISDQAVRDLSITQRMCLFEDERKTQIREKYTYLSCMVDCQVENFLKLCNCIPYYYPHLSLPAHKNASMCILENLPCLQSIRAQIDSIAPPQHAVGFDHIANKSNIGLNCDCMPGCYETRYGFRTLLTNRRRAPNDTNNKLGFSNIFNVSETMDLLNYTTMFIGFKDVTCIRYRRSVYMTWDNFLASVGGIFGLCLGASTISLIEMIYFVIIRIFGRILFHTLTIPPVMKVKKFNSNNKLKRRNNRRMYSNAVNHSTMFNTFSKQYIE